MSKSKKNPNLCTTVESLTKGKDSIFRISGLFEGRARVCWLDKTRNGFLAVTVSGNKESVVFKLEDVQSGKINIMCIERGE